MDEFRSVSPESDTPPLVLVVEDEELVRVVAVDFLEDDGFRVLEAGDVHEAMGLLERERVDLVFSDIQMPGGLDGCDLARWVCANRPGLPVILASGRVLDDSLPGDLRSVAPIIRKPYRGDLLMQRVAAALQH